MIPSVFWGIFTAVLLIAELLTGTMFLYVLAGSGAVTTVYTFFVDSANLNSQLICFAGSSAVLFVYILKIVKAGNKPLPTLNNPGGEFVGRNLTLTSNVVGGHGSIMIKDAPWQIVGPDLEEGASIVILEVKGGVLYYKKESEND